MIGPEGWQGPAGWKKAGSRQQAAAVGGGEREAGRGRWLRLLLLPSRAPSLTHSISPLPSSASSPLLPPAPSPLRTVKLLTSWLTGCIMKRAVAVQALAAAHRPCMRGGMRPAASSTSAAHPPASVSRLGARVGLAGRKVAHSTCGTPASPASASSLSQTLHSRWPALLRSSRPASFSPVRIACRPTTSASAA